ncbi:MAG: hypothetical protein DRR16_15915 [Candidatus Parabeggiatoa sp. nov. 3]|nr:MAG: hypothetical protein DRR00_21125 [Gammaproteobacteria bacterium]RKZ62981.1 MAG: hypothetical protein DRQ99_17865 [Gammaproteobacteria bacterium]RKZ83975.1 MAG: hypothetical protein DRR16_15915 [Gammaproteobacteria bacterium]
MSNYLKGSLEFLGIFVALLISYYELKEAIPSDPIIILEVEKLKTPRDTPAYSLTGIVSDQDYLLESIRLLPHSQNPVKRATFKYDNYQSDVDLVEIQSTMPHSYLISRAFLQQTFGEDNSFAFEFLDNNRFYFYFQFEGIETEKATFECRVVAVDNISIPCEVKETGYLSLFRGIPWYFLAALVGIVLIILIEVIDLFMKRSHKKPRRGKSKTNRNRNQITPEKD